MVNLSDLHMNYPNQSQTETRRTDTSLPMENDFPYYLPDEILQHLDTFCHELQGPLCLSPSPSPHPPSTATTPSNDVAGGVLHDSVMEDASMIVGFDEEPISPAMPTWVLLGQLIFDCSGCSLLREILHGDDSCTMKLMIHGVPGFFYHAILDVANTATGFTQQYFADLRGHSAGSVKHFLMEYGLSRQQEGQVVMSDSMNQFYDVLCVGMKAPVFSNNAGDTTAAGHRPDDTNRQWTHQGAGDYQTQTGTNSSSPIQEPEFQPIALQKTGIAAQRERAEALTLEEISTLFHLPIAKASIRLQLCTTALKKACRRHGVKRWPYRKVQSVDQKIIKLQKALKTQTGTEAAMTMAEIARNQEVRNHACEGFVGKIRRLEESVMDKKAKLRCQSGTEAEITLIEITQLKEKIKRVKSKVGRKGKIMEEID